LRLGGLKSLVHLGHPSRLNSAHSARFSSFVCAEFSARFSTIQLDSVRFSSNQHDSAESARTPRLLGLWKIVTLILKLKLAIMSMIWLPTLESKVCVSDSCLPNIKAHISFISRLSLTFECPESARVHPLIRGVNPLIQGSNPLDSFKMNKKTKGTPFFDLLGREILGQNPLPFVPCTLNTLWL